MQATAISPYRDALEKWSKDGIVELVFGFWLFSCSGIELLTRTHVRWWSPWLNPIAFLLMYAAFKLILALKVRIAYPRGGSIVPPGGFGSSGLPMAAIGVASVWLGVGRSEVHAGDLARPFDSAFSFVAAALALSMAGVFFVCSFRYERRDLVWLAAGSFLADIWMYWIGVGFAGCMLFFTAMGGAFAATSALRLRAFLRDNPK